MFGGYIRPGSATHIATADTIRVLDKSYLRSIELPLGRAARVVAARHE